MNTQRTVDATHLQAFVRDIFMVRGVDRRTAETVADDLVEADRSGVPSHGVTRVSEYLDAVDDGRINLRAEPRVVENTPALVVVDGDRGFGQAVGRFALAEARARAAASGVGVAVVRNSHHIGRVGALCEIGASDGCLVLALVAVGIPGPVAPFGGREGRLGTNPIAFGVPGRPHPIVADFATASMPEGAINLLRSTGQSVPEGVLVDGTGHPTTDPNALYDEPRGAILPFGGRWAHRGFALNLMVELFAGTLSGYGPNDPDRPSNCMLLLLIDPALLPAGSAYEALAAETAAFVRSAAPAAGRSVMLPGDPEAHARSTAGSTVIIANETAVRLEAIAGALGVSGLDGH